MEFKGAGIVWDAEKDQILCKFEDGVYETKVKRDQDILKKLGFKEVKEAKKE